MAQVDEKEIARVSQRAALDDWLLMPFGQSAGHNDNLVAYLTSTA